MKVKRALSTDEVERMKGEMSRELTDRCPDRRVVFPSSPCTNLGCQYKVQQPGYMNCSFVAAEAGEHTLEAIGQMMGITREGVRLIEVRALKKVRAVLDGNQHDEQEKTSTPQESDMATGRGNIRSVGQVDQRENPGDILPAVDDRKLGECGG